MTMKLIERIDEAHRLYDMAMKIAEVNEAESDRLYIKACGEVCMAAQGIVRIVGGKIEVETAIKMIWDKPEEVKAILRKVA